MNLNDNEIADEKRRFRRQVKVTAIVYVVVEAVMMLAFILSYRK
jgi:hypothetical protein